MRFIPALLVIVFVLSSVQAFPQQDRRDPNAALRYLLATSLLPPLTEAMEKELDGIDHLSDLRNISSELSLYLDDPRFPILIRHLEAGANCPTCQFKPDDPYRMDDGDGLYSLTIQSLGKVVRALGGLMALAGKHQEALDIFCSLYAMGAHLEEDGSLMLGVAGFAIRNKLVLPSLRDMQDLKPPTSVSDRMTSYLQSLQRPLVKKAAFVATSRQIFENWIRDALANPDTIAAEFKLTSSKDGPAFRLKNAQESKAPVRIRERTAWRSYLGSPEGERVLAEARTFFDRYLSAATMEQGGLKAARDIHEAARRSENPFVRIAVPDFYASVFLWDQKLEASIRSLLRRDP